MFLRKVIWVFLIGCSGFSPANEQIVYEAEIKPILKSRCVRCHGISARKGGLDLSTIVDAARNAHEAGVPLMIHYMIGLPGETAEEINETLAFALDLYDRYDAWPAVQYATPLPGTALARGRTLPRKVRTSSSAALSGSPMTASTMRRLASCRKAVVPAYLPVPSV